MTSEKLNKLHAIIDGDLEWIHQILNNSQLPADAAAWFARASVTGLHLKENLSVWLPESASQGDPRLGADMKQLESLINDYHSDVESVRASDQGGEGSEAQ